MAAQLSQLPTATAISGSGLTFSRSLGVFTASTDSLGTILTQRGETLGRHKLFVSFNYQRFGFGSIDGIGLKNLNTVNVVDFGTSKAFVQANNRIDLSVDQFAVVGSFGLTSRIDVSLLVPFAKVTLKTGSSGTEFDVDSSNHPLTPRNLGTNFLAGSDSGIGDIAVNLKGNILKLEHASMAVGGEVRFPTGDESNFLGTGAYGFKPYFILSSHHSRVTPNVNLGYQWNSKSALFINPSTGAQLNLPSSFLYSGGADFRIIDRLTLTAEFLGQAVINGPRLASASKSIPGQSASFASVTTLSSTYAMDNIGVGFKTSPFKGFLVTGNVLFKLDEGGLRSKIVPLVGISYRFGNSN